MGYIMAFLAFQQKFVAFGAFIIAFPIFIYSFAGCSSSIIGLAASSMSLTGNFAGLEPIVRKPSIYSFWQMIAEEKRDCSFINLPQFIMGIINSNLWFLYSIVLMDPFLIVPNVIGALASFIQIIVFLWLKGWIDDKNRFKLFVNYVFNFFNSRFSAK
jgi:hypothetical protein